MKLRIGIIFGSITYVFLLSWAYAQILSPRYGYMGFNIKEPSFFSITCMFIAILPSFWVPVSLLRPSQIVYLFLYVIVFIPVQIIPFNVTSIEHSQIFIFEFCLLIAFMFLSFIYKMPLLTIKQMSIPRHYFWIIISITISLFYAYIIYVFGIQFNIVSLDDVYGVRNIYKTSLANYGRLPIYIISWQSNILNPFLIAYGLINKRITPVIIGIVGDLMIYSITGFKSVLLSGLLIFALLISIQYKGKFMGVFMVWGANLLSVLSIITYLWFQNVYLFSLFVERTIGIPGLLTAYYFEFFSQHPKYYLSYSIFSFFIQSPYDFEPASLIGYIYFGDSNVSANANLWADSYANFGYLGLFVITALLGFVFWLFDSIACDKDTRLVTLMLGVPALTLSNTSLLTALLNGGIGLALLLTLIIPNKRL
ncbi:MULTISPECIES: O-antigen polymerase [unclassified Paenibacillus]|uniref:O-antigen polymerase n=1 Tax=unclassified Paenibacillus TaxID=185978 RepID=UPI00362F3A36